MSIRRIAILVIALGTGVSLAGCGKQQKQPTNTASMQGEKQWIASKKLAPRFTNSQIFNKNIIYNQDQNEILLQPKTKYQRQINSSKKTPNRKRAYNVVKKNINLEKKAIISRTKDKQLKIKLNK